MADSTETMVAFLGRAPDRQLLDQAPGTLPDVDPRPGAVIATQQHDRLVAAGSAMTATTLVAGAAAAIFGLEQLLFGGGGAVAVVCAVIGILLVATHWGWVHVAEYVGVGIDDRQARANRENDDAWLGSIAPYPRSTVLTSVLADASTRVERVRVTPVLTPQNTFTFERRTEPAATFDADTPAEVIAAEVETVRRQGRLETDRARELWEAASSAYTAALTGAQDDQQQLEARRAAALALSEHINASLLHPPLVE
jgi:hypothetical protein